jgi:hypothetical protein
MGINRSRAATLVGLGAAIGAFGAAAMMSAATAPTARADDFTDIINAVDGDLAAGQSDFSTAFTELSSNMVPNGLAALFNGLNADLWSVPTNLELGTVEALTGAGITGTFVVGFLPPTDFSDAVAVAETLFGEGQTYFADAATALSSGDYVGAVFDDALGLLSGFDQPAQVLLIGGVEALGL